MVDFGIDLSCAEDMDPQATMVSGYVLLGQAIYRRITTPRGQLIDDPDYGIDVRSMLNRAMTIAQIAALPGVIRQEILKEERVSRCDVKLDELATGSWRISIGVENADGPFKLTVGVAGAEAILLDVTGGGE